MKKINCVIVDDEPYALELLEDYIGRVDYLELIGKFDNPMKAIPFINRQQVDLLFLDIEMPSINGLSLVDVLIRKPAIVFTTAYSEYGAESYNKNALDYLLKPLNFDRFLIAVNKYQSKEQTPELTPERHTIFIKSNGAYIQLNYQDIGYMESLKDYVIFYTQEQRYVVYHSLKKLEKILPNNFQRVHYSFMVNLENVSQIVDHHLHIFNAKIPISRKYRETIYALVAQKIV